MSKYLTAGETATVSITYTVPYGEQEGMTVNDIMTIEITESGAFQYGNQTSATVKIYRGKEEPSMMNGTLHYYDTRYFSGGIDDMIESMVEEHFGGVPHTYTRLEYSQTFKDGSGERSLTYEKARDIVLGTYRDCDLTRDWLTRANNVDCVYSWVHVQSGGLALMAGLFNFVPEGFNYDDDGNRIR